MADQNRNQSNQNRGASQGSPGNEYEDDTRQMQGQRQDQGGENRDEESMGGSRRDRATADDWAQGGEGRNMGGESDIEPLDRDSAIESDLDSETNMDYGDDEEGGGSNR